jgi:small subunit ribosomal protein S1
VENPREVVNQGDKVRVKILEIDSERRRLSLSLKRVEDQILPLREGAPPPDDASEEELGEVRDLGLSEDVFAGAQSEPAAETPPAEEEAPAGDDGLEDPPVETHPSEDEVPAEGEDQPA